MPTINDLIDDANESIRGDEKISHEKHQSIKNYINNLGNIRAFCNGQPLNKLLSGGKEVKIVGGLLGSPLNVNLPSSTNRIEIYEHSSNSIYYYVGTGKLVKGVETFNFLEQLAS